MDNEKLIEMIERYFDNELKKEEEAFLFGELSTNDEARRQFKIRNVLKTAVQFSYEEFPGNLDERILSSLPVGTANKRKMQIDLPAAISAFLTIILLIVSLFMFNETKHYKSELELTISKINQQQQLIQLLMNTLPATEVTGYLKNQVVVTPEM